MEKHYIKVGIVYYFNGVKKDKRRIVKIEAKKIASYTEYDGTGYSGNKGQPYLGCLFRCVLETASIPHR